MGLTSAKPDLAPFDGHVTTEAAVLDLVRATDRPIIVDLDETLFLRNSTEEFLALARPALFAEVVLRTLNRIKPWRWSGGDSTKDSWRVILISLLFPWTYRRWRRVCAKEVPQFVNVPLRDALVEARGPVVIASNGYRRIIGPMLPHLGLPDATLIACQLRQFAHRRDGKGALVAPHLAPDLLARSVVVTDSMTDAPLLEKCAVPCLVVWDQAEYRPAFERGLYLPGDYLHKIKQPHSAARFRLIRESLAMWVIAGLSNPALGLVPLGGVAVLFLSLFSIYDAGYYENDCCAKRFEEDPVLSAEATRFHDPRYELKTWMAATVTGVAGVLMVGGGERPVLFLVWAATLLALRACYWFYNRLDKQTRIWPYLLLQGFRMGGFATVVAIGPVGWAIVLAQVIPAWMDYVTYRYVRAYGLTHWPKTPTRTYRLVMFCVLLVPVAAMGGAMALWTWATPVAFLWFGYLAYVFDARGVLRAVRRLDRSAA